MSSGSWKKWVLITLGISIFAAAAALTYFTQVTNPKVIEQVLSNSNAEISDRVMALYFPDGKVLPVNYLREGDLVFAGADAPWWKPFVGEGARVKIVIKGETFHGHATVHSGDAAYKTDVFSRLRPTVPKWLPDWLNAKLVVITLTQ